MLNWYLACHQPGKESLYKAQMQLTRLHIGCFSPLIRSLRPRPDRPSCRMLVEPLFPGYLFIHFNPELTHTTKITSLSGISHLVKFGDHIKPVPSLVIESLMKLPICAKEQDLFVSKYKTQILDIAKATKKKDRAAMFLAFMETISDSSK
jgi:transcriptional antiterminator RfaH